MHLSLKSLDKRCLIIYAEVTGREDHMRTLLHFRTHDGGYFHSHPMTPVYSLIATFALSVLLVLVLVSSAR
jgi:hypothetical protein